MDAVEAELLGVPPSTAVSLSAAMGTDVDEGTLATGLGDNPPPMSPSGLSVPFNTANMLGADSEVSPSTPAANGEERSLADKYNDPVVTQAILAARRSQKQDERDERARDRQQRKLHHKAHKALRNANTSISEILERTLTGSQQQSPITMTSAPNEPSTLQRSMTAVTVPGGEEKSMAENLTQSFLESVSKRNAKRAEVIANTVAAKASTLLGHDEDAIVLEVEEDEEEEAEVDKAPPSRAESANGTQDEAAKKRRRYVTKGGESSEERCETPAEESEVDEGSSAAETSDDEFTKNIRRRHEMSRLQRKMTMEHIQAQLASGNSSSNASPVTAAPPVVPTVAAAPAPATTTSTTAPSGSGLVMALPAGILNGAIGGRGGLRSQGSPLMSPTAPRPPFAGVPGKSTKSVPLGVAGGNSNGARNVFATSDKAKAAVSQLRKQNSFGNTQASHALFRDMSGANSQSNAPSASSGGGGPPDTATGLTMTLPPSAPTVRPATTTARPPTTPTANGGASLKRSRSALDSLNANVPRRTTGTTQ